jgi:hypothetical protein
MEPIKVNIVCGVERNWMNPFEHRVFFNGGT